MRILTLLVLTACGQEPSEPIPQVDVFSANALRAEVSLLASDEYAGRGTTEPGADLAAAHIRQTFEQAGLQPLPGQPDFAVPYSLYRQTWDTERSTLALTVGDTAISAVAGQNFRPFPFSDTGTVTADVVFAGYGITAAELGWDDYKNLDVNGKIVLVFRHTPDENNEQSEWSEAGEHGLFFSKAVNAQAHGALGMLLVTDPLHHTDADDFRMSGGLRLEPPKAPKDAQESEEPKFLAAQIAPELASKLIEVFATDLSKLQTQVDAREPVQAPIPNATVALALTRQTEVEEVKPVNVIGYLEGTDPQLKEEWVVIGGHYDHLGAFEGQGDTVFNGADDNASGTTGVLAMAQKFAAAGPQKRSLVFAAFSGEELGLLGSRATLQDGVLPADNIRFMLNLDMIGRNNTLISVSGDGFGTGVHDALERTNADLNLALTYGGNTYESNSDHGPFYEADVPFIFLSTGLHDDYHQLSDHADLLDYDVMSGVVRLGYGLTEQVANGSVSPTFVHHVNWLGTTVELVDQPRGAVATVTAVAQDSRADKAGLQVNDILRKVGDRDLEDAAMVGQYFRDITPGKKIRLTYDRGDARKTIDIERSKTGFLGVNLGRITDEFRQNHGLGEDIGVLITNVTEDSPAADAGLHANDTVIALAGEPTGMRSLSRLLTRIGAGERVSVKIIRDGERVKLDITLGERPLPE